MAELLKPAKHTRKDSFRFTVSSLLLPITEKGTEGGSLSRNSRYTTFGNPTIKKPKAKVVEKTFNIDIVFEDLKFKEVKTTIAVSRGGRGIWRVYAAIEAKILEIEEKMKETEIDIEMEEIEQEERKTEAGSKLGNLAIKKG